MLLALTMLYFVTTSMQFWLTSYARTVLNLSPHHAYIIYVSLGVLGPILGVISSKSFFNTSGGFAVQKLGGYNNSKVFNSVLVLCSFAAIAAVSMPYVSNIWVVMLQIFVEFFVGGFALPVFVGVLLNLVIPQLRTLANSYANLVQNLLGYLPGPLVYGIIIEHTGGS